MTSSRPNPYDPVPGPEPVFPDETDQYPDCELYPAAPCPVIALPVSAATVADSEDLSGSSDIVDTGAAEGGPALEAAVTDDRPVLPEAPKYVPPEVTDTGDPEEPPVDAETLIGRILTGNDPDSVTRVVSIALARSEAGMRPVDLMRVCRELQKVTGRWYGELRDRILERDDHPGAYFGYRIDRTAKSRSVDLDALKENFPEAYEATVTEPGPDDFVTKLTLDKQP